MTRTRGNGEELTAAGLAKDLLAFGQRFGEDVEARELGRDLYEVVLLAQQRGERQGRSLGFAEGMQLGAKIENRIAVQALVTALLKVIGDDQGDGYIDLGKVGTWFPGPDGGSATKKEA